MLVNRKNILKIINECDNTDNFKETLYLLEEKNMYIDDKRIDLMSAIRIATEKIKFHLSRFDVERYSKSVILMRNSCLRSLENEINMLNDNYHNEQRILLVKNLITYIEITFDMNITFYTSLLELNRLLAKDNKKISLTEVKNQYKKMR